MFIAIDKIEQSAHHTDKLQNPKALGNAMVLSIYRNKIRTALYIVNTKKTYGEYWDKVENKKIPKRLWTPEMKALYKEKALEAPMPPYIFKITIIGWIFVLLMTGVFGMIVYNELKSPLPKSEEYLAMEKAPVEGDIYFGRYEIYKEKGNPLGMEGRFGWFKVLQVEGDIYHIAKSTEMNKGHKPKEQLNSTNFETESMPPVKLTEQTGYNIRFLSDDGLTEIYITDKK
ncbi:hypothetical protein [Sphingobacterium corticibacterium]|uniref:Uncharacterized protein n=1 Tax=Sphingobacterium corticibacterium TaxID=2484746 RepID=A0A4Q6XUZ2_9SPHI|nr:hypothetical protein [Sphingobacterium corticibacterium]RZF60206.1 hypothetical protein EWE74_13935 [Sphingobacterium corticibacterium]